MNKKTLMELGLTEEQADAVMKGLDGEYVPKARFNEINEAKQGLEQQIAERDKQLDELKKVDAEGLQQKIEELQAANKEAVAAHQAELAGLRLDGAIELALTQARAKNSKAVAALLDREKIKIDGERVSGLDEQLQALKKDNDYLFESESSSAPDVRGFRPAGAEGTPGAADALSAQVNQIFGIQGGNVNA